MHRLFQNHTIASRLSYSTCWYENTVSFAFQWGEKHHPQTPGHAKGLFYCALTELAFLPSLEVEDCKLEWKMERDLKVCCLAWRTWSNIPVQLYSCPAQTQHIAEQSHHGCETMQLNTGLQGGLSFISSLAGVPSTDSYPVQYSLLHLRGCSFSGSEGWRDGVAALLGAGPWGQDWGTVPEQLRECAYKLSVQRINRGLKSLGLLICHLSPALN